MTNIAAIIEIAVSRERERDLQTVVEQHQHKGHHDVTYDEE